MTSDRLSLEHPSARFDLTLDARIVETIRFETANIILELAAGVTLPDKSKRPIGAHAERGWWRPSAEPLRRTQ